MNVLVIAEAGVNHNGSLEMALQLVDAAAEAGADLVKFQTFSAEALVTADAPRARYQKDNTGDAGSQLDMLRRLELSRADHRRLMTHCSERGVGFLSTPFDPASLRFLARELGLERLKLGSSELTNGPLLVDAGRSGKPVILSTGMGTLEEVERALGALAFGYFAPDADAPGEAAFAAARKAALADGSLARKVTLLQCTTAYPTPAEGVNLAAIATLRDAFGLPVGFSDHTRGIAAAAAAVALGAAALEKHITLDRTLPGPDHKASLEPADFRELVEAVRFVERALGDGIKRPQACEIENMAIARKSLTATRAIAQGAPLAADGLAVMRPGDGLDPFAYWRVLDTPAPREFRAGETLRAPDDPDSGGARTAGE